MPFKILIKKGTTVPGTEVLDTAELGYQTNSKIAYVGNGSGNNPTPIIMALDTDGTYKRIADVEAIQVDTSATPTTAEGLIKWDSSHGTFSFGLANLESLAGQDLYYYGKASGSITKGEGVQFAGFQGDHILFKKAVQSEVNANPTLFMGIATSSLSNGDFGFAIAFGHLHDVNTEILGNANDIIWFDSEGSTPGALTKVEPSTAAKIQVAAIIREETSSAANNGVLQVRITINPRLSDLQGVRITSPASGDVLKYDGTKWINDNVINDIIDGTQTLVDTTIRNSAVDVKPLTVNAITGTTANLQEWQVNGSAVSRLNIFGELSASAVRNLSSSSNSVISLTNNGATITRNIADANPSLIVNLQNASSTADILRLQFAGVNKLEVTKDGFINQNGTRFIHTTGTNNTFLGLNSGTTTTSGTGRNVGVGNSSLNALSTGIFNTAVGMYSLFVSTTGSSSTAVGYYSLGNATGSSNTALGTESGVTITSGSNNTFVGRSAGNTNQLATASNSTALGFEAYTDKSNQIVFGNTSVSEFKFDRNTSSQLLAANALFSGTVGIGETTISAQLQVKSGAANRVPLILDTPSGPSVNLQEWKVNGNNIAFLGQSGNLFVNGGFTTPTGIWNNFGTSNAYVNTSSNGTIISRNIVDGNAALIVQLSNTDSTANIVEFKSNISGTTATRASISKDGSISAANLTLSGDLVVNGTTTTINTNEINLADNLIKINSDLIAQVADGLSVGQDSLTNTDGGIEVKRFEWDGAAWAEANYLFQFTEANNDFRIGKTGDLQAVATRQDTPVANGIAYWNNSAKRFDTIAGLTVSETGNLVDARITNSENSIVPLIITGISGTTSNLLEMSFGGFDRFTVDRFGTTLVGALRTGTGMWNSTTQNNAYVQVPDNGTIISRNVNDGNPSLIVNEQQGSGNIVNFQFAGANKLEITKDGFLTQNGTRLFHQTGSVGNTFFGNRVANLGTTGTGNTAFGYQNLFSISSGSNNAGFGFDSLSLLTTGSNNTGIGYRSFRDLITGNSNTGIGVNSGRSITTGGNNTFVGMDSGSNVSQLVSATNSTGIGYQSYTDKSNQMVFGNSSVSEFVFNRNTNAIALLPKIEVTTPNTTSSFKLNTGAAAGVTPSTISSFYTNSTTGFADGFGSSLALGASNDLGVTTEFASISAVRSGANNSGRLYFSTNNAGTETEKMTIMPDGKVGIGTNSPATQLDVKGQTTISADSQSVSSSATLGLRVTNLTNTTKSVAIGFDASIDKGIIQSVDIGTAVRDLLLNPSGGKVGIGTTTPTSLLQLKAASTALRITDTNITDTRYNTLSVFAPTVNKFSLGVAGESSIASHITIDGTNGNVGIGTTSPASLLTIGSGTTAVASPTAIELDRSYRNSVGGSLSLKFYLFRNINNNESYGFGLNSEAGVEYHAGLSSGTSTARHSFYTDNTEKFRISNNGNVGINETSPTAQLQVKSDSTTRVPLIVDTSASHAASLVEFKNNGAIQSLLTKEGRLALVGGISHYTGGAESDNRAYVNVSSTGTIISRNIADTNPALIVNLANAGSTGNIQEWQVNGSTTARVNKDGYWFVGIVGNRSNLSNSAIDFANSGTNISRNIADSNTALKVNQANASSTGNLLDLQAAGTNVISFKKDGTLLAPTTFTIDPSAHGDATGKVIILGDLQVDGTTTTINSTTLEVDDKNIELSKGAANKAASDGAGISIDLGTDGAATLTYGSVADAFTFNKPLNVSGSLSAVDTRITNSGTGVIPLIVNAIDSTTADIQRWDINNSIRGRMTWWGGMFTTGGFTTPVGIYNDSSQENAYVSTSTSGTIITRNVADGNHALRVNLANASSTGDILRLQFAGANKLEITKDGFINQNGTRLLIADSGDNTYLGVASGSSSVAGTNNTALGRIALTTNTSGTGNSAVGASALRFATGSYNTSIGDQSGRSITNGGSNTFIGRSAGFNASQLVSASNSTALGNEAYTDKSNQMVFGNTSVSEFVFNRNDNALVLLPEVYAKSPEVHDFERTTASFGASQVLRVLHTTSQTLSDTSATRLSLQLRSGANPAQTLVDIQAVRSGADNSGRLSLQTNNAGTLAEKMTIMPDGKVGIGTSTPNSLLSVVTNSNSDGIQIRRNGTTNDYATLGFRVRTSEGANYAEIRAVRTDRAFNTDTDLRFYTLSNNSYIEGMRIRDDGLVGINTTTPTERLDVSGTIKATAFKINDTHLQDTATITTTSTTQTALASFAAATYGSGKFLIQATSGSDRQVTELLVLHDGTTALATEYAIIKTGSTLFTVDVDINSGNVRILITSASATSTVYKTSFTLIGA